MAIVATRFVSEVSMQKPSSPKATLATTARCVSRARTFCPENKPLKEGGVMTKFKVFSENKEEEKETYLRLIPICGGVIRLIACDKNGGFLPAGSILEITEEGTIRLRRNISS